MNPNGVATSIYFEYATTSNFALVNTTFTQSIGSGKVPVTATAFLSGLEPGTLYYYRMWTLSPAGDFPGPVETFTTLGFDTTLVAATGQSSPNWATLGNAAVDSLDGAAFRATLTGASTTTNTGIWDNHGSSTLTLVAQTDSAAPGTDGAVYATLTDPVYNNGEDVAFYATLKVATGLVTTTTEDGVWASHDGTLGLLARQGSIAPGTGGASFAAFNGVGLSDNGGGDRSGNPDRQHRARRGRQPTTRACGKARPAPASRCGCAPVN